MKGQDVVTNDDHTLGTVIAERDDCVIVETGHVFKTKHAIPRAFLHDHDGELRATVTKDVVDASPKVDLQNWSYEEVRRHYGLDDPVQVTGSQGLGVVLEDFLRATRHRAPPSRRDRCRLTLVLWVSNTSWWSAPATSPPSR